MDAAVFASVGIALDIKKREQKLQVEALPPYILALWSLVSVLLLPYFI